MNNIIFIVSTLRQTGPTNQLLYIIKNLDKNIFNPIVITLSPEPNNSLKSAFLNEGVEIKSLNLSRIKGYFQGGKIIKKIVDKYNSSIVHTQGLRADELAVKYLKEYNII